MRSYTSNTSSTNDATVSDAHRQEQMFTNVGYYQGKMVAIRKVDKDRIDLSRTMLVDLKIVSITTPNKSLTVHYIDKHKGKRITPHGCWLMPAISNQY